MHMYVGLCVLMRYGCVRIHNGNKWALTQCIMKKYFESSTFLVEIHNFSA